MEIKSIIVSVILVVVCFSTLVVCTSQGQALLRTANITVGANVHVSAARPNIVYDEVLMAADPSDPSRLVACVMSGNVDPSAYPGEYVFTSFDNGRTWDLTLFHPQGADPACAYGPNGIAYFALQPLTVYYATDGGRAWTKALMPSHRGTDRSYLSVDTSGGKYNGRVYLYAQSNVGQTDGTETSQGVTLWRSLDGGKTFERPVQRLLPPMEGARKWFHAGSSVVLSDGTWAAVLSHVIELPKYGLAEKEDFSYGNELSVFTSTNGGDSINPGVKVSTADITRGLESQDMPVLAADVRSAVFKDRMYVVWLSTDTSTPYSMGPNGRTQVMLSRSSDYGKTWSTPRQVSDDFGPRDSGDAQHGVGLVSVAVNNDGVVGVVWEDRRDNTNDDPFYDIRFSASFDGGDTFTPSVRVNDKPHLPPHEARWVTAGRQRGTSTIEVRRIEWVTGGDTMGLAADANGAFHPLWIDNRTGVHQVWTTTITTTGRVAKFGSPDFAGASDISDKVAYEVLSSAFDRSSRRVTLSVRVRNRSTDTIMGPIKLRVLNALTEASSTGTAEAVDADNGVTAAGAIFDLSTELPAVGLQPGSVSAARTLTFQLPDLRPVGRRMFGEHGQLPYPTELLRLEVEVVGTISQPTQPTAASGKR